MGDNRQVRLDNWGIYLLHQLQVFFSKTDYCDLTLQFEGNVQLKVHRLVLCACTEYFTLLEQSCPAHEENTIMMPSDLQADVIVPIVNFMYTGMLEFKASVYERLCKVAELMNITVLIKLLSTQKTFLKTSKKKDSFSLRCLQGPKLFVKPKSPKLPAPLPGRKLPIWKRKNAPTVPMQHPTSTLQFAEPRYPQDPLSVPDNTAKPSRFEWPDDDLPPMSFMDTSFENISYTSDPLITREEEMRATTSFHVRKNSNNESTEGESNDTAAQQKRKLEQNADRTSVKRVKLNDKENTISIKSSNGADLDHTKIVSEILKKYPQLVKKNKNIKLKIMASGNKNVTEQTINAPVRSPKMKIQIETPKSKIAKPVKAKAEKRPPADEGPWVCDKCDEAGESGQEFVLYYLFRKHMTDVHSETFDSRLCKYCGQWCSRRNLMLYHLYTKHGLKPPATYTFPKCDQCPYIALSGRKLAQHKLHHNPGEMQCANCQLAFTSQRTLTAHIQITGHLNRTGTSSHDCQYCTKRLQSPINLFSHMKNTHLKEAKRDGIVILDEMDSDNDVEEEEEEEEVEEEEEETVVMKDKVKIISNVKVPARQEQPVTRLEPSTEAEALSNVASGIATSLGLVDIVVLNDNEQYILPDQTDPTGQPKFIISDLARGENHFAGQIVTAQHGGHPQGMLQATGGDITSTDELVMVLTDHDYQDEQEGATADNSNIVVLYSHPVDGQQGQFITSQGNLLVNSQTGMLEIQNEAIPTVAATQMVDTSESIESIQREIQSHQQIRQELYHEEEPKVKAQPDPVQRVEEPVQQEETVVENIEDGTGNLPQEEEPPTEQPDKAEEPEVAQESSNIAEEPPVKEQTGDPETAVLEEPMETDKTEQPVPEEQPIEKETTHQEPATEEPPPATEQTEPVANAAAWTDFPPTENGYFEESMYVFNDPSKTGSLVKESESTEPSEEPVPETAEADSKNPEEVQEDKTEETAHADEENKPEETETEEKPETEETRTEDAAPTTESTDQPPEFEYHDTDTAQCNDEEEEDDVSQSSQGTTVENSNQASINRAILEDWEDTDSQPTEEQQETMKRAEENIHKLMDDWAEEEEDDDDDKKEDE